MQNYCKTIGALAAASALVAGNALAGTSAPVTAPAPAPECDAFPCLDYELHVGYTNEYLFRGNSLGLDLVEAGFDVATQWDKIGLSAGVWYANFDTNVTDFGGNIINDAVNEIDLYAEASYDLGFMKAAVGYIYYYNDQDDGNELFFGPLDDAQEVYFAISRDFGFAEASLTYFWDISGADNDGYTELGFTRSFELAPCLALNLGTNVSYLIEQGDFGAWTTKVGLDWSFAEHAKLSPFVALAIPLSDEDDTYYGGSDNEFVGGSMLTVSF
jgi:predicted porin